MKSFTITLRLRATLPTPAIVQLWLTEKLLKDKKDLGRGASVIIETCTEEPSVPTAAKPTTPKQRRTTTRDHEAMPAVKTKSCPICGGLSIAHGVPSCANCDNTGVVPV